MDTTKKDEWYAAHPELINTEITFTVQSKRKVCERCDDTFPFFFLQAPDGTELDGCVQPEHPKFILTKVCGDRCLTQEEQDVMVVIKPDSDWFNIEGLEGVPKNGEVS